MNEGNMKDADQGKDGAKRRLLERVIIAVVATAVGAAVGATVTVFAPRLIDRFWGEEFEDSLIGRWGCNWTVTEGLYDGPNPIIDNIEFTNVTRTRVEGEGTNPNYGPYPFEGKNSNFAVVFTYRGTAATSDLVGTVLLERQTVTNKLKGVWHQYGKSGDLLVGTVVCAKAT